MYEFFRGYSEPGVPSFAKFAQSTGFTVDELSAFRAEAEFERSWRECAEIRKDLLIDAALIKRFDSSLTKFLLGAEFGLGGEDSTADNRLEVTLEVLGE